MGINDYSAQLQLQPAGLEWITGAFIDNAINPQKFELVIEETGQVIVIPAFSQGLFEIVGLIADKVGIRGQSTGGLDVSVRFLNYVPHGANSIWAVTDPGQIVGAITVNGQVTALPPQGNYTQSMKTITTGGISSIVAPANANRRRLIIGNPAISTTQGIVGSPEPLYIRFGATATADAASMEILPGGAYDSGNGPCHTGVINGIATTSGHRFNFIEI